MMVIWYQMSHLPTIAALKFLMKLNLPLWDHVFLIHSQWLDKITSSISKVSIATTHWNFWHETWSLSINYEKNDSGNWTFCDSCVFKDLKIRQWQPLQQQDCQKFAYSMIKKKIICAHAAGPNCPMFPFDIWHPLGKDISTQPWWNGYFFL